MPIRRPPSGMPLRAVIFRMSCPAFSLICSMRPRRTCGPAPESRSAKADQKSPILCRSTLRDRTSGEESTSRPVHDREFRLNFVQ